MSTFTESKEELQNELINENNSIKANYEKELLEQKQIIEVLEFKDKQHKAILGSALSGFWRYDLQGRLLEVNEEYCRMSGFSKKELLKMHIHDLEAIEDQAAAAAHINKITKNGFDCFESKHRRKDGSVFDVAVNIQYLDIGDGQILGFHTDITERKQILNKLSESEQMFRDLIQNSPIGQVVIHMDGRITDTNIALCNLVGYSKEEFSELNLQDITHPDDADTDLNFVRQMMDGEIKKYEIEKRFIHKDKHLIWVLINFSFVLNDDGSPKYFIGQIQDITERKNKEMQLKHRIQIEKVFNEVSYQFVCNNYLETDHSINSALEKLGLFTEVDRAYVFQLENDETSMSNLFEWCNKGIQSQINDLQQLPLSKFPWWMKQLSDHKIIQLENISALPEEARAEHKILEKLGITSILVIPMFSQGRLTGFIGFDSVKHEKTWIDTDIMMLKTLSDLISGELSRTQSMYELIEAKQKAKESDRLKSAFLANMSHEIRTPMNGILGFTELLLEPDLTSEQKEEYIKIVHNSGQRMLNTVTDIVEISKIEAGSVQINSEKINVNECIEELIAFFKNEAENKGLKLLIDELLPETSNKINTDLNKFNSILTNLIKNAVKYTNSGTINIGCRRNEAVLEFYVKDTGIGIPADRQSAIFERFMQADITTTRAFDGSGLGLAISKSYIEMLGGKIWVQSKEGVGSTFYISLPVHEEESIKSKYKNYILKALNKSVLGSLNSNHFGSVLN